MIKSYSSITASYDTRSMNHIIRISSIVLLLLSIIYAAISLFMTGTVSSLHTIFGIVVPLGMHNFVQIMNYNKRDIIRIMQPSFTKHGILSTLKTIVVHVLDLIIIPTIIALLLFIFFENVTTIYLGVYIIQIFPLTLRKDNYVRDSNLAISQARDEIRTSRILMTTKSLTADERDYSIRRHMAAEEMMCVHSDFLVHSASIMTLFITGIRYLIPVMSPILYRIVGG